MGMLIGINLKHFTALLNLDAIKHIHVADKHMDIYQLVITYVDDTTTTLFEGSKEECVKLLKSVIKLTNAPVLKLDE